MVDVWKPKHLELLKIQAPLPATPRELTDNNIGAAVSAVGDPHRQSSPAPMHKRAPKGKWSEKDTLDLIAAVKWVDYEGVIADASGIPTAKVPGGKWIQVAERMPPSQMASREAFHTLCRSKFQELRRIYQGLVNPTMYPCPRSHKLPKAILEKMLDYVEEVPPEDLKERYLDRLRTLRRSQTQITESRALDGSGSRNQMAGGPRASGCGSGDLLLAINRMASSPDVSAGELEGKQQISLQRGTDLRRRPDLEVRRRTSLKTEARRSSRIGKRPILFDEYSERVGLSMRNPYKEFKTPGSRISHPKASATDSTCTASEGQQKSSRSSCSRWSASSRA